MLRQAGSRGRAGSRARYADRRRAPAASHDTCSSLSVPMLRLVRLAEPTVRKRSSTASTFEWMYVAAKALRDAVAERVVETERVPGLVSDLAELLEVLGLPEPDGELLLERLRTLVHHDDDLEPSGDRPPHPRSIEGLADAPTAEVLRFDVDEPFGRADRIDEQVLHLADAGSPSARGWVRLNATCDGTEREVAPGVAARWRGSTRATATAAAAAGARQRSRKRSSSAAGHVRASQVDLYVMVRFVRFAATDRSGLSPRWHGRPSAIRTRPFRRRMHACRRPRRTSGDASHPRPDSRRKEVERGLGHPVEVYTLHPFALSGEHDVEVPRQDVDVRGSGFASQSAVQETSGSALRRRRRIVPAQQRHATVELPPRDEDVSARRPGAS